MTQPPNDALDSTSQHKYHEYDGDVYDDGGNDKMSMKRRRRRTWTFMMAMVIVRMVVMMMRMMVMMIRMVVELPPADQIPGRRQVAT